MEIYPDSAEEIDNNILDPEIDELEVNAFVDSEIFYEKYLEGQSLIY